AGELPGEAESFARGDGVYEVAVHPWVGDHAREGLPLPSVLGEPGRLQPARLEGVDEVGVVAFDGRAAEAEPRHVRRDRRGVEGEAVYAPGPARKNPAVARVPGLLVDLGHVGDPRDLE